MEFSWLKYKNNVSGFFSKIDSWWYLTCAQPYEMKNKFFSNHKLPEKQKLQGPVNTISSTFTLSL